MTEPSSKSRQQAEIAFAEAQSQFLARGPSISNIDPVAKAREEKTMRLREARLAKESEDKVNPAHSRPGKKA
jgi:hypothetical protein